MNDEELIDRIATTQEAIELSRKSLFDLQAEMLERLHQRGAREAIHPDYDCAIKVGPPSYDHDKLIALWELLPPEIVDTAYTPLTTRPVPEKWNGAKLNSLEKKYGGDVAEVIGAARIPGRDTLVIREKANG